MKPNESGEYLTNPYFTGPEIGDLQSILPILSETEMHKYLDIPIPSTLTWQIVRNDISIYSCISPELHKFKISTDKLISSVAVVVDTDSNMRVRIHEAVLHINAQLNELREEGDELELTDGQNDIYYKLQDFLLSGSDGENDIYIDTFLI